MSACTNPRTRRLDFMQDAALHPHVIVTVPRTSSYVNANSGARPYAHMTYRQKKTLIENEEGLGRGTFRRGYE